MYLSILKEKLAFSIVIFLHNVIFCLYSAGINSKFFLQTIEKYEHFFGIYYTMFMTN